MAGQRWLAQVLSLFLGMIGVLLIVGGGVNLVITNQERAEQQAQQVEALSEPEAFVVSFATPSAARQGFRAQAGDDRSAPGVSNLTPAGSAPLTGARRAAASPSASAAQRSPGALVRLPSGSSVGNGAPALRIASRAADDNAIAAAPAQPVGAPVLRMPTEAPTRIVIPAINLDAPIVPVPLAYKEGDPAGQYLVPDYRVVGWHADSARLGEVGNLVMNGHHNVFGRVFEFLKDLKPGDEIAVYGSGRVITYTLSERHLLQERGKSLAVRQEHAEYLYPTSEQILTLVTCWPPRDYSHRLILIARPVADTPIPGGRAATSRQ